MVNVHGVLQKDDNGYPVMGGVSSVNPTLVLNAEIDPISRRLLVDDGGGGGGSTFQYKSFVTVGTANADYIIGNYIDVGDAINAAYAGLPSAGGIIFVYDGNYSFSTPIVLNTAQKMPLLMGAPGGATTLTYTGSGTSVAITVNVTAAVTPGYGLRDIKFVGPSSTGSTAGILLGGLGADDGKGFAGGTLRDVHVRGFGGNIVFGNNCFIVTFDNVISNFGGVLLFAKGGAGIGATNWTVNGQNTINSGERMVMMNCTFADANNQLFGQSTARFAVHLQESGLTDWKFLNTSFDDAELYLDESGGTGNQVSLQACHFENPAGDSIGVYTFITTLPGSTSTSLDLSDCTFVQDANTSAAPSFLNVGCQVSMKGCTFTRNTGAGAATLSYIINFQDATTGDALSWMGCSFFASPATSMTSTFVGLSDSGWADGAATLNSISIDPSLADFGGTVIVKTLLVSKNTNTVYDASQFSGADIGAKINAAYAFAVAAGQKSCLITIPAGAFSFSTPVAITTDGVRASIRGQDGDATVLTFTGGSNTTAFTFNCGYQGDGAGSEHVHYVGLQSFTLKGNATSTTNPEIGVFLGGTNGAAGIILDDIKIEGFGQGLVTGSNTYFYSVQNTVIRNCGQNVYIGGTDNSVTNSGEGVTFLNCFIVDTAGNAPANGFMIDNSGATSISFFGGSFDDCQVRIQQANGVSFYGTHFENPGASAWGAYTYLQIDQNPATNVNMNGCIFWQDGTGSNVPTNFISNGGTLTMDSCWARTLTGSTVTNFVAITGSGRLKWSNLNRVATGTFTNVVSGIPYISSGWTDSTGVYSTISQSGVITFTNKYVAQTATYAILTSDYMVDCTSGTFTATLPTAVGWTGKTFVIKNSGAGTITIATTSAQTIDGSSTVSLSTQYAAIAVISDGANYKIIG